MSLPERCDGVTRRGFLGTAAALPLAVQAPGPPPAAPPPPRYTTSINIEIMFPRAMPKSERISAVAAEGITVYSFWQASEEDQKRMLEAQHAAGMTCSCVVGSGRTGRTTGLTKPGAEQQYLDELAVGVAMAKRFGGADAIIFPGARQPDLPWEQQRETLIAGLRRAGDLAREQGVHLVLEALNRQEAPTIAISTAEAAFDVVAAAGHPNVRVDFDMYHLQLTEGNLINNLRRGLKEGLIRLVQIGDVPGRREPGTGEINFASIYRVLREVGYAGYVDSEHGTSTTPAQAIAIVKRLAAGTA